MASNLRLRALNRAPNCIIRHYCRRLVWGISVCLVRWRAIEDIRRKVIFRIEVPRGGSAVPQAGSKHGMSKEVARATRSFLTHEPLSRVVERVQSFMDEKAWSPIWTTPYMPSSQPIALFWPYGKRYGSSNPTKNYKLNEACHGIRQGWYSDKDRPVEEGGWKEANNEGCVRHAIQGGNA